MKKERKIGDFCISSIALRWKFIISLIWEREANQRMILHLFRIHHFVIWLVVEFSMRNDIVGSGWKFENPCTYHFPWIVTLRLEAGRLPGRGGSNLVSAFANAWDQIWSRIGALMVERGIARCGQSVIRGSQPTNPNRQPGGAGTPSLVRNFPALVRHANSISAQHDTCLTTMT